MRFSDILGHQKLKQTLISSVKQNYVAHAQLFLNDEGGAALALAWAYATYLNCTNKQPHDACGQCASCVRFDKLIHPDLHFIFPTAKTKSYTEREDFLKGWRVFLPQHSYPVLSDWADFLEAEGKQFNISVAESRYISKILSLKAYEGGYKILILWLPEYMNASAANALLKGLEEPPNKTIFLLVAENIEKILTTVLSRCQLIKVPRYTDEEIRSFLINVHQVNENFAEQLATLVDGNINEAIRLSKGTLNENQLLFQEWMRLCFKHDYAALVEWADKFNELGKEGQKMLLQYALTLFREALISKFDTPRLLRTPPKLIDFVTNFAKVVHEHNIFQITSLFDEAYFHLERNANSRIVFMDMSIQLARLLNPPK